MTLEEKIIMADSLRGKSTIELEIPEEFRQYLEDTERRELWIDTSAGKSHIYVIKKKNTTGTLPLYINIHGGGFVRPHLERDIIFTSRIACETGCLSIDVDYKLAPEHPYPTAFLECYDVVRWAFNHADELGIDPARVIVGGHSSGGNLTASVALKANVTGEFKIRLQILDYPPLDLLTDPMDKEKDRTAVITPERARAFNALYVEDKKAAKEPYASPVLADQDMMQGLPEALIITAGEDSLRFEAEQYALKLAAAGVKTTVQRFLGCRHGFMTHCTENYAAGHKLYIDTIRQVLNESE